MSPDQLTGLGSSLPAESCKPRTGLVTLLFTDIVSSTALKQQLGDQGGAALFRKHHQLMRELVARFPTGQEIETAGDSFLIIFSTPSDAVRFGLLLQSKLRGLREEDGVGLFDRIGIHVGEVVVQEDRSGAKPRELYGIQIDTCSRVMSLAKGGQVLMSRGAFDSARQVLKGEDIEGIGQLEWLNHGAYLLKGLEEAVEICEVREVGKEDPGPPTSSEKAQRKVSADEEPVLGWRPAIAQLVPNTRWVLEKKLGEGGFGEVWLGRNPTTKEPRVFKFCFKAERIRFLKRELTLFRLLKERVGDHPNIVRLHDVYLERPPFYVEMDYVEGEDLKHWFEDIGVANAVGLEVKLEIVAQVAEALQAAHDAGVIHRDVKPANILVSGPRSVANGQKAGNRSSLTSDTSSISVRLNDFGIGQVISKEALDGITRTGFTQTILAEGSSTKSGTLLYLAPELLAGKQASIRSDIYALGVVLFQLLAGDFSRPVTAEWSSDIADPLLIEDLKRCLAGNPQDRFDGAGQLAKHLRLLPDRRAARARQQADLQTRERAAYRRGIMRTTSVAALVVALIGFLAVMAIIQSRHATASSLRAQLAARELRRSLYAADMHVAFQTLEEGNLARVRELLDLHRPKQDHEDLRGFEWRYLWQACQDQSLCTFKGHTGTVHRIAFSPDGKHLATGSADGTMKLWDIALRREVWSVQEDTSEVAAIAFSTDGHILAMGTSNGTLKLWDAQSRLLLGTLIAGTNRLYSVAFSRDGRRLATGGADGLVRLWDTASQQPESAIDWQHGVVECVRFSPNGKILAIGGWHTTITLWDVDAKRELAILRGHTAWIDEVAFSPDGKTLATGAADSTVRLWDVPSQRELFTLRGHSGQVLSIAFSPDGEAVASGSADGTAKLWNLNRRSPIATFLGHTKVVSAVVFSPGGDLLASGGDDGTVKLWALSSLQDSADVLRESGWITDIGFSQDGNRLVSVDWNYKTVTIWDPLTMRIMSRFTDPEKPLARAAFLPDGKALAISEDSSGPGKAAVRLRDTSSWKEAASFPGTIVGLSADGRTLATLTDERAVCLWDVPSRRARAKFTGYKGPASSAFAPAIALDRSGSRVAMSYPNGDVVLWDGLAEREMGVFGGERQTIDRLRFSPDAKLLAAGRDNGMVSVWDLASGREVAVLKAHSNAIDSLAFSPDGATLVTGGRDGTAKLWNLKIQQAVATLRGHTAPVSCATFSPDGQILVTASGDATIKLWRAPTLEEIERKERSGTSERRN